MTRERLRVLLVDDHNVVRQGLRRVLETSHDVEIVGEVGTGAAALTEAARLLPDVVVMDVSLPDMSGVDVTRTLTAQLRNLRVLMLSMHAEEAYVAESVAAGAGGYVLKDDDDNELAAAIRAVARGQRYFSNRVANSAVEARPNNALSPRERDVLALIGAGLGNRQIAERLAVSVNTVETHRRHIIEKLNLHSTAELVRYALRHQIAE
jgi:DNA-binding NarL/FixJ family response regulator